jgi:hypothetical protein
MHLNLRVLLAAAAVAAIVALPSASAASQSTNIQCGQHPPVPVLPFVECVAEGAAGAVFKEVGDAVTLAKCIIIGGPEC